MSLDSPIDVIAIIASVLMVVVGILAFFGITFSFLTWIAGAVLIIGGIAGLIDGFIEWSDNVFLGIVYVVLFLITIAIGVTAFYPIPGVASLVALIPGGLTNYIVNGVLAVLLFSDAALSD